MAPATNSYYMYISGICGVVKTSDGMCYFDHFKKTSYFHLISKLDVNVIVGSGVSDLYGGETEIYSQNNNSFEFGPVLPYPLQGAATVQYGDSLIVIGGYDNNCYCDNSGNFVALWLVTYYILNGMFTTLFQQKYSI